MVINSQNKGLSDLVWSSSLTIILACGSLLYGAVILTRRWLYDHGFLRARRLKRQESRQRVPRVLAVGGLVAGGSGKTPVVEFLLHELFRAGQKVGLLSRGYARESKGVVVYGVEEDLRALTTSSKVSSLPQLLGDEPAMLATAFKARWGVGLPLALGPSRYKAARALLEKTSLEVLVLDDAFTHRQFARDVDILVLQGEAPWGGGYLLPRGALREPLTSLKRADIIWLYYKDVEAFKQLVADRQFTDSRIEQEVLAELFYKNFLSSAYSAQRMPLKSTVKFVLSCLAPVYCTEDGEELTSLALSPKTRVVAAAGIARPTDFLKTLQQLDLEVLELVSFRDHQRYTATDLAYLLERKQLLAAAKIVVTAKDALKLRALISEEIYEEHNFRRATDFFAANFLVVSSKVVVKAGALALEHLGLTPR